MQRTCEHNNETNTSNRHQQLTPHGHKQAITVDETTRAPYHDGLYDSLNMRVSSQLSSNSSLEMKDLFTSGHMRKKSPTLGYH